MSPPPYPLSGMMNLAWSNSENHEKTPYDGNSKYVLLDGDDDEERIQKYKQKGHILIGYVSAGSCEGWRDDKKKWPKEALACSMDGWDGETWINLKNWELIKPLMEERLKTLKNKGFDGVEADNIAVEIDGRPTLVKENIEYAKWFAETAHKCGLMVVFKNGSDHNLAAKLSSMYDAIIIEEALRYDDMDAYREFKNKQKNIWAFEYPKKSARLKALILGKDKSMDQKQKLRNKVNAKGNVVSGLYLDTKNGWEQIN